MVIVHVSQSDLSEGKGAEDAFQPHVFICQVGEIRKPQASHVSKNAQVDSLLLYGILDGVNLGSPSGAVIVERKCELCES